MLTNNQQTLKRGFDLLASVIVIPLLIVPLIVLWIAASLSTGKNGLYHQQRIGRYGKPFYLLKLRSLKGSDHEDIVAIKQQQTTFGGWLRQTRLDELPQLFNVLAGEMSLVGPRPDVPGYADKLSGPDRDILQLRPGITGPATLKYKNEDELLSKVDDPNQYNDLVIWPDKVRINKIYQQEWSFVKDLRYLWLSVVGGSYDGGQI